MSRSAKNRLYSITASLCSFVLIATVILTVLRSSEQAWGAEMQDIVSGQQIVDQAVSYIGTPYHQYSKSELNASGGPNKNIGYDAPLFVRQVFDDLGFRRDASYEMPSATSGWAKITSFMLNNTMYEVEEPNKELKDTWQMGDILFFGNSTNPYAHIGIYVGRNNTISEVAGRLGISTDNVYKDNDGVYWKISCVKDAGVRVDNQLTMNGMNVTKVLRLVKKGNLVHYNFGIAAISKTGQITDTNIANAVWRVYDSEDKAIAALAERGSVQGSPAANGQVATFETDENGHTSLNLPNATYYCVEWSVKTGSFLSDTIYELNMTDDTRVDLTNEEWYTNIKISGIGTQADNTEVPVAGAEFTLYEYNRYSKTYVEAGKLADKGDGTYAIESYDTHDKDGNVVKTITNEGDKVGNIYYTDVNGGSFMIKETKFPEGYNTERDEYVNYFYVTKDNAKRSSECRIYHYVTETATNGNLNVYNVNAEDTEEYLSDGVFELHLQADCSDETFTELKTDENGKARYENLPAGNYYIRQKYAKDGFFTNANIFEFTITGGQDTDVIIPSEPKPGYINFFLSDEEYVERDENGNITDKNYSTLNGAVYNIYTDENCKNPAYYVTWSDDRTKVYSTGEQAVLTNLINQVQPGNKDDSKFLMPGTYYFKEITAPAGYELDENAYPFTVIGNAYVNVHAANRKASHKITIVKRDAITGTAQGADGFKGTEFMIKPEEDVTDPLTGTVVGPKGSVLALFRTGETEYEAFTNMPTDNISPTATTGADGQVTITGLYPGKYVIIEAKAPAGYELNDNEQIHVDISGTAPIVSYATVDGSSDLRYADTSDYKDCSEVTVYFYDGVTTKDLVIYKTDAETDKPLAGAGFSLYRLNRVLEANGISELPTDSEGNPDLTGINLAGLEETFPDGKYNDNNTVLYTDENGLIEIQSLLMEKYLIAETVAPAGYKAAPAQIADMSVGEGDMTVVKKYFKDEPVKEVPPQYRLRINKYIAEKTVNDHPDTEAVFCVTDTSVEGMEENALPTTNGILELTEGILEGHTYKITEIKAPDGYNRFKGTMTVTITNGTAKLTVDDGNGNVTESTLEAEGDISVSYDGQEANKNIITFILPVPNSTKQLVISKVNKADNSPLAGATLELYKADADGNRGELVESWVSEETAKTFDTIPAGNYILHEAEAPEGFMLAEDIAFTIADEDDSAQIIMADEPEKVEEPTEPPTEAPTEPPAKEPEPEPDFTYHPVKTGDTGIAKNIALMFISGTGLLISVILLILNNKKPKFEI